MQIQINYGDIKGSEAVDEHIQDRVGKALSSVAKQVTRIEVHLRDDKQKRDAHDDKRCKIEVRISGIDPFVVEDRGSDIYAVISSAAEKVKRIARREADKRHAHR